ncbi:MAG: protein-disulfide reductase DsbD domain-containing protein [Sulfitobacter sp.]
MKSTLTAFAFTALMSLPAGAQDQFEIPVTGEILPGWQQSDGSRMIGLRMKLAPGWKTYWRTPGDAGIPPRFAWSGSQNIASTSITWPTPSVFLTSGMRTIGYTGDVVLPVVISPHRKGGPITLEAQLDIGVCADICVPHRMELSAVIDDTNTKPTPAIAAALAARPYTATEAGVTSASCALRPTAEGLAITATLGLPSIGESEVVIIEPGQPGIWMSETKTHRTGSTLTAVGEMEANSGAPVAIKRSDVRITVLGKNHAVDIRGCVAG